MSDWLAFLPQVVLAQALGVGLAWGVDTASWKSRRNEDWVFSFNALNLMFVFPCLLWQVEQRVWVIVTLIFWLVLLATIQRRQLVVTLKVAFFGALMQFGCFVWGLMLSVPTLAFLSWVVGQWVALFLLISMVLTYALLSLFRPSIYSAGDTFRQFARKNRPMR